MRSRLKIAERMGVGFALMLAVLALMAWMIVRQTAEIERARRELTTRIAPLAESADLMELRVLYVAIGLRAWLVNPAPETLMRHRERLAEARAGLLALEMMQKAPDEERAFAASRPLLERYLRSAEDFVTQVQARTEEPGADTALSGQRELALESLREFRKLQHAKRDAALVAIQSASDRAERGVGIAIVVALVLFLAIAALTVRTVRTPAQRLVEVARRMELGDSAPALELAGKDRAARDELGILRQAFSLAAIALERREQRLRTDGVLAKAAGASLVPEEIARPALEAICEYLHAELGVIYGLPLPAGERVNPQLRSIASKGTKPGPGAGLVVRAAEERRAQLLRDSLDRTWLITRGADQLPAQSVLAVPILSRGEVLGVVLVASLQQLGEDALAFLEAAAQQLGVGLQNAAAHEQIKTLVTELGRKSDQVLAQNEELQVQNEELHAQAEEIRVQNEELQAQAEEIRAQNEELGVVSERLQGQAVLLEEADERKTEFLGVLAHELRNPLAAISNSLFALSRAGDSPALRERAEQVIGRQTKLLSRLIEDLLDVTRINSGKIRIDRERVDLAAVLRSAVEDSKVAAERAGTRVELQLPSQPAVVEGDPVRLQQVVGNLIDNAIKFGGDSRPVVVSLAVKDDRSFEVKVKDDGVGIDGPVLNRLFVPFSQADTSVQRHRSGLGLGLALVKALVELHGGSVKATSDGLGRGAEFTVLFPSPFGRGSG